MPCRGSRARSSDGRYDNMIGSLLCVLAGRLLIAIGIACAIGPARLLADPVSSTGQFLAAGLVVVPVLWVIITATAMGAWVLLRWHGAAL
jgi:hypothetical protein